MRSALCSQEGSFLSEDIFGLVCPRVTVPQHFCFPNADVYHDDFPLRLPADRMTSSRLGLTPQNPSVLFTVYFCAVGPWLKVKIWTKLRFQDDCYC